MKILIIKLLLYSDYSLNFYDVVYCKYCCKLLRCSFCAYCESTLSGLKIYDQVILWMKIISDVGYITRLSITTGTCIEKKNQKGEKWIPQLSAILCKTKYVHCVVSTKKVLYRLLPAT
jgi:hypothetical protein